MTLTYAELFAGAGGLSMGLEAAGFHAIAHAEIEPHARAVLRHHWPETRLDGDVTKINGADYDGCTLLSGGSPCQDLSVAGKRAGLGGARSGLFYEQVRIWQECQAPYLLWENVGGALSSNAGKDFAAVLSALVGSAVAVPADGWRGGGGVVAGRDAVAAWRVLDLQHFGPPQRRVRVFVLAARTGGVDPAEVLALGEGVCGHPSPRQQAREGTAGRVGAGAESGGVRDTLFQDSEYGVAEYDTAGSLRAGRIPEHQMVVESAAILAWDNELNASAECHGPSMARGKSGGDRNGVVAFGIDQERNAHTELMGTLNTGSKTGGGQLPVVMSFESTGGSWGVNEGDTAPPIKIGTGLGIASPPAVIAFDTYNQTVGEVSHTLRDPNGTFGDALPAVVCTTVTHEGADASEDGTGRGTPIVARMVAFGEYSTDGTASTIKQRDYKDATDHEVCGTIDFGGHGGSYNGQDAYQGRIRAEAGRPRRLTPKECERLMSWPDDHTRYGTKDDGTVYELSDTARYRLCGNGVGSVCVQWIAGRLAAAITGAMGVAA